MLSYLDRNRDLLIAVALSAVTLVAGWLFMVPGAAGVFHDDGIYVATAKSLALGHGYRLINLPDAPVQTKYPPLYPILLAFVWKLWPVFPDNLLGMQWLTLLMSGLSVGLFYHYVTKYGYFSCPVALVAAFLSASSHFFLYYSTLSLSEMPFAFFLCLGLLSLENLARTRSHGMVAALLLIMLITLPFLTRTIGGVLIPVALIVLFLHRRPFWSVAFGSGIIVLAWFIWTAIQTKTVDPFTAYYTSYASWWSQLIGVRNQLRVTASNFLYLLVSIGSLGTTLLPKLASFKPILGLLTIPFGVSSLIGVCLGLRKRQILPCFLSAYLLVILVWPWPPGRFVIPILIFLLGYSLNEIWNGLRNGHRFRGGKALASVICGILILGNVWNTYQVVRFNGGTHYPSMIASSDTPVAWSSFLNMFAWIRANTGPADIIASPFDSMVFLYTERVAFRPFSMRPTSLFYGDPTPPATIDQLFSGLTTHKAQYLMRTPMLGFGEEKPFSQLVEEFRKKRPGCLRLVYVGDDPRFMIFKVQP